MALDFYDLGTDPSSYKNNSTQNRKSLGNRVETVYHASQMVAKLVKLMGSFYYNRRDEAQ